MGLLLCVVFCCVLYCIMMAGMGENPLFPLLVLFRNIRDGLVAGWCLIRNALWSFTHRSPVRKPYLSADTVEELEIECYIGPYSEPFRAESLKAREAERRKRNCEFIGGDHLFAMNGRCALCGDRR